MSLISVSSSYMEHVHQTFTHSFTLIFHVSHISFIVIHGTRPPDIHSLVHTNFSCLSYQFHCHTWNTSTRHSLTRSHSFFMSLISVSSSYMQHVHQTFTHSFTLIFLSLISVSSSYMQHVHQTFTHSFTLIFHVSHISFIVIHGTRPPDIHSLVHTNFSCLSYQFHRHTWNTSTRHSLTRSH